MDSSDHSIPFRLAAIDLDGTLLGPDLQISAANLAAVAKLQAHGIRVVLASGRSHKNILRFHRQLELEGPIVSCQGALVRFAETDQTLYHRCLPADLAAEIVRDGLGEGMTLIYHRSDGIYISKRDAHTELYHSRGGDELIQHGRLQTLAGETPFKIIWINAPTRIAARYREVEARYRGRSDTVVTYPEYLEFIAHGVNKAVGIAAVANYYGLDHDEVLAFGDGDNDIPMLQWAGVGVAMSESTASAKAASARVVSPGDPETSLASAVDEILRYPAKNGPPP
jgi:Cof subfamily protein (haloacid dehalogenase superfamily)